MDSVQPKPKNVFRIIDRKTKKAVGSYSRGCHNEVDFDSVARARTANCHGMFENDEKYAIAQYRVYYVLINPDVKDASKNRRRES